MKKKLPPQGKEVEETKINISIVPPPSGPICDFCSDTPVFASHPCESFVVPGTFSESLHNWAACKVCDELIRNEDWEELLQRSVKRYKEQFGAAPPWLKKEVRALHREFRRHRKREC